MNERYKIMRYFQDDRPAETIRVGLSLAEAQEHCHDPETHGEGWFDGYTTDSSVVAVDGQHRKER